MNFIDPQRLIEVWWILAIFYFVWCWGLPMLGMLSNPWAQESKANYWKGVRWVSATFHISTIIAIALMWYLAPYMFPTQ